MVYCKSGYFFRRWENSIFYSYLIITNDIIFDNGFGLQTLSDVDIDRTINGRMPGIIFNKVSIFIALDVIDMM